MWSLIALVTNFFLHSFVRSFSFFFVSPPAQAKSDIGQRIIINHEKWCRSENYYFLSKWFKPISEWVKISATQPQRQRDWIHIGHVIDFRNCCSEKSEMIKGERERERSNQRQVHNSCVQKTRFVDLAQVHGSISAAFFAPCHSRKIYVRANDLRNVDKIHTDKMNERNK